VLLDPFEIVRPYGRVTVTLEVAEDNGTKVCGIYNLEGHIGLPPKQWLRIVRAEVANFERIAREAGCAEMRLAGRDWSRILRGYEPLPGLPNGLRKALTHGRLS
jgi:hypothetical protein